MNAWPGIGAILLGVQVSISPCTLAGNIAAISLITRDTGKPLRVLTGGLLYTLGRAGAYLCVAAIILVGIQSAAAIDRFFSTWLNQIIGPMLIVVGLVLLGWVAQSGGLVLAPVSLQRKASGGGPILALVMGVLLALSFCPVSAGLFFGPLLSLARTSGSTWVAPMLFGVGSALPVVLFSFLIAFAAQAVGKAFETILKIERILRKLSGAVFVLAGIFYCLVYIYDLPLMDW